MVAKFLKDLSGNTNPKKVPRLLNRLSEETTRAWSFMRTLKYVTDKELIAKYIAAEAKREEMRAAAPLRAGGKAKLSFESYPFGRLTVIRFTPQPVVARRDLRLWLY